MIAGTWSINEFIGKEPVTNGTVALNSMFCIPGYYLIEESSPTSAGNMEWFIRNLMNYEKEEAKAKGGSVYGITNEWVASISSLSAITSMGICSASAKICTHTSELAAPPERRIICPRPEYKEIYEEKYATYRAVIEGLSSAWERFKN